MNFGLAEETEAYSKGIKTSLIAEFGFGKLRGGERKNMNGKMGAAAAWHSFSQSQLPQDFDCAIPTITAAAKSARISHARGSSQFVV